MTQPLIGQPQMAAVPAHVPYGYSVNPAEPFLPQGHHHQGGHHPGNNPFLQGQQGFAAESSVRAEVVQQGRPVVGRDMSST